MSKFWVAVVVVGLAAGAGAFFYVDQSNQFGSAPKSSPGATTSQSAGATACRISSNTCVAHPERFQAGGVFMDKFQDSDKNAERCMKRAEEYYGWCKSTAPIKAEFLTNGKVTQSTSYP